MNYMDRQACNNAYNVVSGWLMVLRPLELIEQFERLDEPVPRRLYEENDGACRCCGNIVEENEECPTCGTRNDPL